MFSSENTAIKRKKPSAPAKYVIKNIIPKYNIQSVLDWGCGYGADVSVYRKAGMDVSGYDPCLDFGFTKKSKNKFDLITCIYVLNTVPTLHKHYMILKECKQYLKDNGKIFIASRSFNEIEKQAKKNNWQDIMNGYISSKKKRTYQEGIKEDNLFVISESLSLDFELIKTNISGAVCVLMGKHE